MDLINTCAAALQPGDFLTASERTVVRVVLNGLYERTPMDTWTSPRRPFPRGKVEIVLDDDLGVRYWNRSTAVQVMRPPTNRRGW